VVRFTLRPIYLQGKSLGAHWIGGWVSPRVGLDAVVKRKIPVPRGIHIKRFVVTTARSQMEERVTWKVAANA